MYKRIKGKKFSRKSNQRKAFINSLAMNLILHEKIKTTKIRAKSAAQTVDKMITKAKLNNLAAIRSLAGSLPANALQKLTKDIAPRFADRHGGYTRVINLGIRQKDGSPLAIVELTQLASVSDVKKSKEGKDKNKKNKKHKKEKKDNQKNQSSKKSPKVETTNNSAAGGEI